MYSTEQQLHAEVAESLPAFGGAEIEEAARVARRPLRWSRTSDVVTVCTPVMPM